MDKWKNQVAVVTGASAGIGAAIFKEMAMAGLAAVGLARRKERVEVSRTEVLNEPQENCPL
jgi:NADP+-dependent farnesol dehydrogenase